MRHGKLTAQATELSRLTRNLSRCCQAKEEELFAQFGLSCAEGRVLLSIADLGVANASAVAGQLAISKGRLTPLVDGLVRKGFLTRTPSVQDRRSNELIPTETGQEVSRMATQFQVTFHEELLRCFKAEERSDLLNMLEHLHSVIEESRSRLKLQTV